MAQEGFEKVDNQFALIIDEMKIKSGLVSGNIQKSWLDFVTLAW